MGNEYRSQAAKGGRVDYVKAGKPSFDLAAEAKVQRAKMGGSVPSSQPVSKTKVKVSFDATPRSMKKPFDDGVRATKPSLKDTPAYAQEVEEK